MTRSMQMKIAQTRSFPQQCRQTVFTVSPLRRSAVSLARSGCELLRGCAAGARSGQQPAEASWKRT